MSQNIKPKKDIENWWADNPMTYGDTHGTVDYAHQDNVKFGTKEFFETVDQTFYEWNAPLHDNDIPFSKIYPYGRYKGKKVLEIGCGMGTMAMNWAKQGAHVTAVDLNPVAIEQTKNRFKLHDLKGTIKQCDANILDFKDESFDYVYSWGVLHHSPDLEKSLDELFRVLKTDGEFGIMLYNRHSFLHWYMTEFVEGFLHDEYHHCSPLELASRYGDGAREEGNPHTWPITKSEIKSYFEEKSNYQSRLLGTDMDHIFSYMLPGLSSVIPKALYKPWARRFGWSHWITGVKKES